jgi:hypothetical protein
MIIGKNYPRTHVVFNREKKLAFHSRSWNADIDALGISTGWVHDTGEWIDEEYFTGKGFKWISNRLDFLKANATKLELIFSGSSCDAYFVNEES